MTPDGSYRWYYVFWKIYHFLNEKLLAISLLAKFFIFLKIIFTLFISQ